MQSLSLPEHQLLSPLAQALQKLDLHQDLSLEAIPLQSLDWHQDLSLEAIPLQSFVVHQDLSPDAIPLQSPLERSETESKSDDKSGMHRNRKLNIIFFIRFSCELDFRFTVNSSTYLYRLNSFPKKQDTGTDKISGKMSGKISGKKQKKC